MSSIGSDHRVSGHKEKPARQRGLIAWGISMFQIVSEHLAKGKEDGEVLANPNATELRRSERWVADRLKRGKSSMISEIATITPELASVLLRSNTANRKVRRGKVAVYASDIKAGRWVPNGESIIICNDGIMASGQHRCLAVIEAGASIESSVVFGAPPEARKTVDSGETKSSADRLALDGVKHSTTLAAAAKSILLIDTYGRLKTGINPSQTEVLEFIDNNPDLVESTAVGRAAPRWLSSPGVLTTAHFLLSRVSRDAATEFTDKLLSGENLARSNPIYVLREKLRNESRLMPEERLRAIFYAWNNWRAGRSIKIIKLPAVERGYKFPELQ